MSIYLFLFFVGLILIAPHIKPRPAVGWAILAWGLMVAAAVVSFGLSLLFAAMGVQP